MELRLADFGLQCDRVANANTYQKRVDGMDHPFRVHKAPAKRNLGVLSSFERLTTDRFHQNIEGNFCLIVRDVCDEIWKLVSGESRVHCGVVVQQDLVVHW